MIQDVVTFLTKSQMRGQDYSGIITRAMTTINDPNTTIAEKDLAKALIAAILARVDKRISSDDLVLKFIAFGTLLIGVANFITALRNH